MKTRSEFWIVLALITISLAIVAQLGPVSMLPGATSTEQPSRHASTETIGSAKQQALEHYGNLLLQFEVNRGQVDDRVKFLARGSGYNVSLTATEAVLALRQGPADKGLVCGWDCSTPILRRMWQGWMTCRATTCDFPTTVGVFQPQNGGGLEHHDDAFVSKIAGTAVPPPKPAAPSNLLATATSTSRINLRWTDRSSNESGFAIERCRGASCTSFRQVATVGANSTSYNNTGLAAGTTYRYRVRAYNAAGNSAYSTIAAGPDSSAHDIARVPLGRFGTPEELAKSAAFLASSGAAFIVGSELTTDGGLTVNALLQDLRGDAQAAAKVPERRLVVSRQLSDW